MKILTRYIFSRFAKFQLSSILVLIFLYTVVDFLKNSGDFIPNQAKWHDIALFYFYLSPFIVFIMAPYTVLFSTIACLCSLLQNNEIIAMRSSGQSLSAITAPILCSSFIFTLCIFICNEFITPAAYQKTFFIKDIKIRKQPLNTFHQYYIHQYQIWYHSTNNTIWNVDYFDAQSKILKDINIYHFNGDRSLTKWIQASSASHNGEDWIFENAYIFQINGLDKSSIQHFNRTKIHYHERPDNFLRTVRNQKGMNIQSIYAYRNKLREQGIDARKFDVDLHYKISYPFICIIMALIGIPISLNSGRSGGILFSIGLSFFIGWAYFYIFSAGISFGHRGLLPPWLSAWGVNIIGMSCGFYLLLSMDGETFLPSFTRKRKSQMT